MAIPHSRLKIALVSDELTQACLAPECRIMPVTPWNATWVFRLWRPDLLLVETSWNGWLRSWRYKMAAYPDHPERNNNALGRIVDLARRRGIKTVFWNREDGVHFDRFIESARLFDYIFTVDEQRVPDYQAVCGPGVPVGVLMFAVQPTIHFPTEGPLDPRAAFVGSYSQVHPERRAWQDQVFAAAEEIGMVAYDRNWRRKGNHYRFPDWPWIEVRNGVPHRKTADLYRGFLANINVNTITSSGTAFSRRLVEILACGGFTITNPTPAVMNYFADYCSLVSNEEEAREVFRHLAKDGLSRAQQEKVRAGADYVLSHHTWRHRLEQIVTEVGI